MKIKSKYWLEDDSGEVVFGEGRRKMLELIDELGSMQATAKSLNMSYRGVWARIKATEERLGIKLVETSVGRGKDRGSKLTDEAKKLLHDYKMLNLKGVAHADKMFDAIFRGEDLDAVPLVPLVAVIGLEDSGTDELILKLIKEWSGRGRRIGVLRKCSEPGKPKKPEKECLDMGAYVAIEAGPGQLTIRTADQTDLSPESLAANYALGADLVLYETHERVHLPTIELYRRKLQDAPLTRRRRDLLAVVGDRPAGKDDWPHFPLSDLAGLIDLVEKEVLDDALAPQGVNLVVDGRRVPQLPFVQNIIDSTVIGLVSSLKSCTDPRDVELTIRRK